jgi:transaldolase
MKILLDSLDAKEIKKYAEMGLLYGVTTNPTFSRRYGMHDDVEMVKVVREALGIGEIHVEAWGETEDEILKNAEDLIKKTKDTNLVFKIPFSEGGVAACNVLSSKGLKTNLHLIYSINQALLASTVEATYICPLVGRLDDVGHDALQNVELMKRAFTKNNSGTKIMVSSVRNPQHVLRAYLIGADVITIPTNVLSQMFKHPLTEKGMHSFKTDINAIKQISSININRNLIVDETKTVKECLALMVANKSGAVAVTSNGKLSGIFTAGDLERAAQKEINVDVKIKEVMKSNPITINITETVSKAEEIMVKFNVDHLVVVDDSTVIGILNVRQLTL